MHALASSQQASGFALRIDCTLSSVFPPRYFFFSSPSARGRFSPIFAIFAALSCQSKMTMNPARLMLQQGKTALLICDLQTRFSKVIFDFDAIITNTTKLVNACKFLKVPMLVTEQNPKSLGSTVANLDIAGAAGPFAKTQFSMCTPEVKESLAKLCSGGRPESVLLVGIEGHVCIENTAMDLRTEGYEVHAVADCISSRTHDDRMLAFERMRQIGCVIASSENVVYKLLGDANHEQFRNIQGLMRTPSVGSDIHPKL